MSVAVLGSINMDIVLSVADIPKPGETVIGAKAAPVANPESQALS